MTTPVKIPVVLAFFDPAGNPLAGGSVRITLSADISTASSGGPQVTAQRTVAVTLDDNGTAVVSLWPNSTLSPAGTVYFVQAFTAEGQPAWDGQLTVGSGGGGPDYILTEGDVGIILLEGGVGGILTEVQ
jgi:hypothetical protein